MIIIGVNVFQRQYLQSKYIRFYMGSLVNPPDCLHILTIGVINEARKLGIGKKLIMNMVYLYRNQPNVIAISLDVIDYNTAAIRFYKRLGF